MPILADGASPEMGNNNKKDMEEMEFLMRHVFFPRKLPQQAEEDNHDGIFVKLVTKHLRDTLRKYGFDFLKPIVETFTKWSQAQCTVLDENLIMEQLKNLKVGQTFSIFLRESNGCLMIRRVSKNDVVVTSFRVSPSAGDVVQAMHELSATFPGYSVQIPMRRVTTEMFARHVALLGNVLFPEQLIKTNKKGEKLPEERNVTDASLLRVWLMSVITGDCEKPEDGQDFKRVAKKIRDSCLWKNAKLPWRRSAEWLAVKAVLHTELVRVVGDHNDGKIVYKVLTIILMSTFLDKNVGSLSTDLGVQMMRKVARRMAKIENLLRGRTREELKAFGRDILNHVAAAVKGTRHVLEVRHQDIIAKHDENKIKRVSFDEADFEKDTVHKFSSSRNTMNTMLEATWRKENANRFIPKCMSRYMGSVVPISALLFALSQERHKRDLRDLLFDVEIWSRDVLFPCLRTCSCTDILQLLKVYTSKATVEYKDSPELVCQSILTAFTMMIASDREACRKLPMLLEHSIGFDTEILHQLLLPTRCDMKLLSGIESYVARRRVNARFPSLIEEGCPTSKSFAVRYAKQNKDCISAKKLVLTECKRLEKKKKRELHKMCRKHKDLCQRESLAAHKYKTDPVGGYILHDPKCSKCQLKQSANSLAILVHERSLPEGEIDRNAVMFECEGPSEVFLLRDTLTYFHDWLGLLLQNQLRTEDLPHEWDQVPLLRKYTRISSRVSSYKLRSSTKLFSQSHYKARGPTHFTNDSIVVPCGFNARYKKYSGGPCGQIDAGTMKVGVGARESLQWAVSSTSHTQNMVLSRQMECPRDISRSTFISFCSLRAGHRLQLRNIVLALEDRGIPFDHESEISLLSQALWEAGPALRESDGWSREVHADLRDELFARRLLDGALRLLENAESNWGNNRLLVAVITIMNRVLSLSERRWAEDAAAMIRKCRKVGVQWARDLQAQVLRTTDCQPHEVRKTRIKLVEVSACIALTFSGEHIHMLLRDGNDAACWLRSVAQICDNSLLEAKAKTFPTFTRGLVDRIYRYALIIEDALHRILENGAALCSFVKLHWRDRGDGRLSSWKSVGGVCRRWYEATFTSTATGKKSVLQMDILRGDFLVDGAPIQQLPKCIIDDERYRRVFGLHIFTVQPSSAYTGAYVAKAGRSSFVFGTDHRGVLWIEQNEDCGKKYRLLSHATLKSDLPVQLDSRTSLLDTTRKLV